MSEFDPAKEATNLAKHGAFRGGLRPISLRRARDKEMKRHAPQTP